MPKRCDETQAAPSVLFLTQFHAPEPCAAANRVGAMTRALQEAGFDVHIVTGVANFPSGAIAPSDRVWCPTTTFLDSGTRLTRVFTFASTRLSGRNRILNWLSVSIATTLYVVCLRRHYDYIIVTVPPVTLALPALVAIVRHRAKLVVDVRDVFPDVAIKIGYWRRNGVAARTIGYLSAQLYRVATLVLAVTESARAEVIERGSTPIKTRLAPNGFDPIRTAPESPYRRHEDEFVASFVGNMGLATGLDVIFDAAALLRSESRIRFVLAGSGADYARLAERMAREDLTNIVMLGVVPRDSANALIADTDVAIVPLHASLVDSLPTKLFDALILGCPVVCCANGEAREFIERSGGGIAIAPQDGESLAAALLKLLADPLLRQTFANRGRQYVLENYDRSKIMRSVASWLTTD